MNALELNKRPASPGSPFGKIIPADWLAEFEYRQAQEIRNPDAIVASKAATNRQKDRESLPRLRAFREYRVRQRSA